jgi:hypothetical protein
MHNTSINYEDTSPPGENNNNYKNLGETDEVTELQKEINFLYQKALDIFGKENIDTLSCTPDLEDLFTKPIGIVKTNKNGLIHYLNNVMKNIIGSDALCANIHKYIRCSNGLNCTKEDFDCFCKNAQIFGNIKREDVIFFIKTIHNNTRKMSIYLINNGDEIEFVFYFLDIN